MEALTLTAGAPVGPDGALLHGLTAGSLRVDPVGIGPRTGRVRRWRYAAAGDGDVQVGAAVVDLGYAAAAFAWACVHGVVTTWEDRVPLGRGAWVGTTPDAGAGWSRGGDTLLLDAVGGIRAELTTARGPLEVEIAVPDDVTPATLVTSTAAGGWNATEKAAGHAVTGSVSVGGTEAPVDGGGWRDWTSGRQDRRTSWTWAAAAGRAADGRRVGLNLSTGMNAGGVGEDVLWLDGQPFHLDAVHLAPLGDPSGRWEATGDGWGLAFEPHGVRAAEERLPLVHSRYVQPIGTFHGTLPDADGRTLDVELIGVTEEHEATW